jgi:cyanophycin synthetase
MPESGKPRPVGEAIMATLFPLGQDGRIPLVAVAGPADTTTLVSKLIAHLLGAAGTTVGLACSKGTFVAGTQLRSGDCRSAECARGVLINPLVEAAVLETSFEGILEEGVAFDRCQVAVITSIGAGVKLDFAEWEERVAHVHRSVSDIVLPDGAVVLKAGEPLGSLVIEHCPAPPVLFSVGGDEEAIAAHTSAGGKAVVARSGQIVLLDGKDSTALGPLPSGLPAESVLPAVAAAWAAKVPTSTIVAGLKSFAVK